MADEQMTAIKNVRKAIWLKDSLNSIPLLPINSQTHQKRMDRPAKN